MTIDQLVKMGKRIHDTELYNLGATSSRDHRNAFWARVVGCAHHGHPTYNPSPDPQWHLKRADVYATQSDDVVASLPSREAWDCIPGAGANGYWFEAHYLGVLPPVQVIYAPPKPSGAELPPAEKPAAYPGDAVFDAIGVKLFADYGLAGQAPNPQMGRWFGRTIYDWLAKGEPSLDASLVKHRKEWRAILGLPVE